MSRDVDLQHAEQHLLRPAVSSVASASAGERGGAAWCGRGVVREEEEEDGEGITLPSHSYTLVTPGKI
jgi:hypothetical protein